MEQNAYLKIMDRAIESEMEAARFYSNVAEKTTNSYLKEMFITFSKEEQKHRRILEGFRNKPSSAISFAKVSDFGVSETIPEPVLSIDMQPADAIALAMKKEGRAKRFRGPPSRRRGWR